MIPRSLLCAALLWFGMAGVLTGCWDTKDINKRLMPVVMGICKNPDQTYRIILQIPSPEKKGSQYLESSSATINKAIDHIRSKAEKSIDLLHIRLFLICEKTAKSNINDIIDYAVQANDISIKGLLGIVRGNFEQLMYHHVQANPELSSYDFFSEQAGWTPNNTIFRLWEAYRDMKSYTQDMAIPILSKGTDTLYKFEGSAILRKDKIVGEISSDETMIYNIFQEKYTGGTIEVSDQASVLIKKATIRNQIAWAASGPQMNSHIRLNVVISENKQHEAEADISQKLKDLVEMRGRKLIGKLQEEKADSLGVGKYFRSRMTEEQLKDWKLVWFPQLKHEITADVKILNSIYLKTPGKMKNAPQRPDEQNR
ncbi:hypothetical protein SK3146_00428 [Paenibacillus konkukensis]|uniref:Uncharacterized protein n=1 Tax=Paenibacillus konkukensis TaxID=2020716 RepID=A0ABY4RG89_9BACL|nr:Ger(x)C family spore germination protein [Paenibacillus konkukensis]UQZ81272.1 hypothetical protein SK3146_00428 [Paenibacillus konkukensis]